MELTHFNEQGRARMVDVSEKVQTYRVARAAATVRMAKATMDKIKEGSIGKGDVLAVAQVAGIMAAKKNSELIPMCHPLLLTKVDISFEIEETALHIRSEVRCHGETGVEMEALTAVSVAALTVYDMCKACLLYTSDAADERSSARPCSAICASTVSTFSIKRAARAAFMKRRNEEMAQVTAVNISEKKGVRKHEVPYIDVKCRHGIVGDAHAGDWHRQISLLADESVDTMRAICQLELDAGIFAENINTRGIELKTLPVGTRLRVGETELEVTQIGKQCHNDCEIKRTTGKCVMPTEGIFAIVIKEGRIQAGDEIEVLKNETH